MYVVAEVRRSWCPFLAMTGLSLKAPNVVSGRVCVYVCCMCAMCVCVCVCVCVEGRREGDGETEREGEGERGGGGEGGREGGRRENIHKPMYVYIYVFPLSLHCCGLYIHAYYNSAFLGML